MIIQCDKCKMFYDDEFRWTFCDHEPFMANDGQNNFARYPESWCHVQPPSENENKKYEEWLNANKTQF